tara:strand:- start:281 stop:412 length:132 start_codon:yes stop_codon:yes gene_type:complete
VEVLLEIKVMLVEEVEDIPLQDQQQPIVQMLMVEQVVLEQQIQ